MSNLHLNHAALEECLQMLDHLFIDIARLTYEQGYEEIVGGYCELKVATLDSGIPSAKLVAAKRLRLGVRTTEPKRLAFRLARELKVWAGLQHPHVLPLLGFYLDPDYKSAVLISEYMGHGDLKNYIAKIKPSFDERLSLVRDLTDGLAYLHTLNAPIRHGDLKPGNVLVNQDRRALLADFGLSKALDTAPTGFTTGNDARGTVRYSSPEVLLQGPAAESLSNDIWSWGCLVLEALTDKIPFANIQLEPQLIIALVQGRSPSDDKNYLHLDMLLVDLFAKCWSHEPNERPTAIHCLRAIEFISPPPLPSIRTVTGGGFGLPSGFNLNLPTQQHNPNQPQQHPHIPPHVTSSQPGALWNELQQRYINQVQRTQQLNQNQPQQHPHITPRVTLPQAGALWNELQQRYINQVQQTQQLNQDGIWMHNQAAAAVAGARQNQQGGAGLNPGLLGGFAPTGANSNTYNIGNEFNLGLPTQHHNPNQPKQHPHILPRVTSPQNGALWNELQERYVKAQQTQQLKQNDIATSSHTKPDAPIFLSDLSTQSPSPPGAPDLPSLGLAKGASGNDEGAGGAAEDWQNQNQNQNQNPPLQPVAQLLTPITSQKFANMAVQDPQDGSAAAQRQLGWRGEGIAGMGQANAIVRFSTAPRALHPPQQTPPQQQGFLAGPKLKRSAEEEATDSKGSTGPSGSSKRARKAAAPFSAELSHYQVPGAPVLRASTPILKLKQESRDRW